MTTTTAAGADPEICEQGGKGNFLPLFDAEYTAPKTAMACIYFMLLAWCFLGVSIIADIFMGAIEAITSKKRVVHLQSGNKSIVVKVWNNTVANLTLMALGSSAPEILLSVIEIMTAGFHAGALGPSTIVGSAAFNLLVIIAVCVFVIPTGESRTIRLMGPFIVTASGSLFAYIWLVFILGLCTPNVVQAWEGVTTFLFFFVLVVIAYLADIGKISFGFLGLDEHNTNEHLDHIMDTAKKAGIVLDVREARMLAAHSHSTTAQKSKAQHKIELASGSKPKLADELSVCFTCPKYVYPDNQDKFLCEVKKKGKRALEARVGLEIETRDGNMKANDHYERFHALVLLNSGTESEIFEIKRSRQTKLPAQEPSFTVHIVRAIVLKSFAELGKSKPKTLEQEMNQASSSPSNLLPPNGEDPWQATFQIEDKEGRGEINFVNGELDVTVGAQSKDILVSLVRNGGAKGQLTCRYHTEPATAVENYDYIPVSGELIFEEGQTQSSIAITIKGQKEWEGGEMFLVHISGDDDEGKEDAPEQTSRQMSKVSDGESIKSCAIKIASDLSPQGVANQVMRYLDRTVNVDTMMQGTRTWKQNLMDALFPPEDEDGVFSASAIIIHIVSLPWKLLFALVPPPTYCGGWLTFFSALMMIGVVTAFIADLASLFGCVMGIEKEICAISIVALGTSLPDTFASMTSAVEDESADNAIGNVTGSNAVNVFLGLGLPWTIASIYWQVNGPDDKWRRDYSDFVSDWPDGVFVVRAGDLTFSVILFTACSISCLSVLMFRRHVLQAELGGPLGAKLMTTVFFVSLWAYYVGVASWKVVAGDVSIEMMVIISIGGFLIVCCIVILITVLFQTYESYRQNQKDRLQTLLNAAVEGSGGHMGPLEGTLLELRQQVQVVTRTLSAMEMAASTAYRDSTASMGGGAVQMSKSIRGDKGQAGLEDGYEAKRMNSSANSANIQVEHNSSVTGWQRKSRQSSFSKRDKLLEKE